MLQHTHNHAINVADALRLRPISDETKLNYLLSKVILQIVPTSNMYVPT